MISTSFINSFCVQFLSLQVSMEVEAATAKWEAADSEREAEAAGWETAGEAQEWPTFLRNRRNPFRLRTKCTRSQDLRRRNVRPNCQTSTCCCRLEEKLEAQVATEEEMGEAEREAVRVAGKVEVEMEVVLVEVMEAVAME